ncbi:MAG: hypothetical protein PHD30_07850 [Paludibacter sp.]|nr:hypothetical protein [Paludibacter sp.]
MIENIEQFIRYIPTARGTNFEDIKPFLDEAEIWIVSDVFGKDLNDVLKASDDETLKRLYESIISLKGYVSSIPFLDVVQTNNGFAVVNNSNHVPASKERVERLIAWVNERLYTQLDGIIVKVYSTPALLGEWSKFHRFNYLTELLYWTGIDFVQYGGDYEKLETNVTKATISYKGGAVLQSEAARRRIPYLELRRLHGVIKGFQDEEISNFISRKYMNVLIDKNRSRNLTKNEELLINRLKFIIGLFLQNEDYKAKEQLKVIVNEMIADLPNYTDYAGSDEYKLKIAARYENLLEDPTYFFG